MKAITTYPNGQESISIVNPENYVRALNFMGFTKIGDQWVMHYPAGRVTVRLEPLN